MARLSNRRIFEATLLNTLGMILTENNNVLESIDCFEKSLAIHKELNNHAGIPMPLSNLGMAAGQIGKLDDALRYYEEAQQLAHKIGHRRGEALVLSNLGWVAGMLGEYSRARGYLERSLFIARETGNLYIETNALINLSSSSGALGDYVAALGYANRAVELARKSNDHNGEAWALTYMGHNLFSTGALEQAITVYRDALVIRRLYEQAALAAEPGAGLARVLLAQNDLRGAQEQVEAILQHIANGGNLDGTDEPVRVYLNCYLVLAEANDGRAPAWLRTGYDQLNARAASIPDAAARQKFFEQVSYNREMLEAWKTAGAASLN